MTETDIKSAIRTIEIHHEGGWWIAQMPDLGIATQAKTLPALGIEIERIITAHFEAAAAHGIDPFAGKHLSTVERYEAVLTTALEKSSHERSDR
jgi:predicted RNase H-like HicB family nuclease